MSAVFVAARDGPTAALYALDVKSGAVQWWFKPPSMSRGLDAAVGLSPDNRTIVVGGGGYGGALIYGVDARTGKSLQPAKLDDESGSSLALHGGPGSDAAMTKAAAAPAPVLYTWPVEAPRSTQYAVKVNGVAADVLQHQGFSWCSFASGFETNVTVEVTPLRRQGVPITCAVVRPLRHGVRPTLAGGAVTMELGSPAKLSVEVELAELASLHVGDHALPSCAEGAAHPDNRTACAGARAGMTSEECARLGCCYTAGPSPDPHHDPWCFSGSDAPPPAERPPLLIFAEPLEDHPPAPGEEGVVYFGAGMHDPNPNASQPWCPLSEAKPTLYLAPGACE